MKTISKNLRLQERIRAGQEEGSRTRAAARNSRRENLRLACNKLGYVSNSNVGIDRDIRFQIYEHLHDRPNTLFHKLLLLFQLMSSYVKIVRKQTS